MVYGPKSAWPDPDRAAGLPMSRSGKGDEKVMVGLVNVSLYFRRRYFAETLPRDVTA
jgi:hypothetical protein